MKMMISIFQKMSLEKKLMPVNSLSGRLSTEIFYGTDKSVILQELEKNSILMNIDVQGALQIKQKMPQKTILIFLKTKNIDELRQRILKREKMPQAILDLRLSNARKELKLSSKYDYNIFNDRNKSAETTKKVIDIIEHHTSPDPRQPIA